MKPIAYKNCLFPTELPMIGLYMWISKNHLIVTSLMTKI